MVEGPTEEEFVNNSLSPYLKGMGIANTVPILLETSPGYFGGDVTFNRYQLNAQKLLLSDPGAIITSLIDYYQLRTDFPGYETAMSISDKNASVDYLEAQIATIISDPRFIPYIQLHEFEGLLFSDMRGFNYIPHIHPANKAKIQYVINNYRNPELINDGTATAPSKRLQSLIPRYKKTLHGPIIALENGINPILEKCPRFRKWIDLIKSGINTLP
jgi:hypothetical protein